MARYIDRFVMPVPQKKLGEYRRTARGSAKAWTEAGAPFDGMRMIWSGFEKFR